VASDVATKIGVFVEEKETEGETVMEELVGSVDFCKEFCCFGTSASEPLSSLSTKLFGCRVAEVDEAIKADEDLVEALVDGNEDWSN
jgi:hypothetical protein